MAKRSVAFSRLSLLVGGLLWAWIAVRTLSIPLAAHLDGDEHQFMTSAFLVASEGLVPYRDFAYFHVPGLVFLYAALFKLSYPFLAARLVSGLCMAALFLVQYAAARSVLRESSPSLRLVLPAAISIVLAHSALVAEATAKVWNHATSTLCAVLALLVFARAIRRHRAWPYFLTSGILLGCAANIRLTFAALAAPLIAECFVRTNAGAREAWRRFAALAAGGAIASIPALILMAFSPGRFWFGNIRYALINFAYRQQVETDQPLTLSAKVAYFGSLLIEPANLPAAMLLAVGLGVFWRLRSRLHAHPELRLLLLSQPFVALGALTPTPAWPQYFSAPVVFAALLLPYAVVRMSPSWQRRLAVGAVALVVGSFASARPSVLDSIQVITDPRRRYPLQFHRGAEELSEVVRAAGREGRVLTLAPMFATDVNLPTYPQFATGRFAWRTSYLLAEAERRDQLLVGPDELDSLIAREPPLAILTEGTSLEAPLVEAAKRLGLRPVALSEGRTVWLREGGGGH